MLATDTVGAASLKVQIANQTGLIGIQVYLQAGSGGASDKYVVLALDKITGKVLGSWSGVLPNGYRPAACVIFTKLGGTVGGFTLDNIQIDSLK